MTNITWNDGKLNSKSPGDFFFQSFYTFHLIPSYSIFSICTARLLEGLVVKECFTEQHSINGNHTISGHLGPLKDNTIMEANCNENT